MDSFKQNYEKLNPVDKITPRLHGFLMVTPNKPPIEQFSAETDTPPNIYELLSMLTNKVRESCNNHQQPDEKLLNVLTRLKRFLKNSEANTQVHYHP